MSTYLQMRIPPLVSFIIKPIMRNLVFTKRNFLTQYFFKNFPQPTYIPMGTSSFKSLDKENGRLTLQPS